MGGGWGASVHSVPHLYVLQCSTKFCRSEGRRALLQSEAQVTLPSVSRWRTSGSAPSAMTRTGRSGAVRVGSATSTGQTRFPQLRGPHFAASDFSGSEKAPLSGSSEGAPLLMTRDAWGANGEIF